ncbi:MAG TPA: MarR family transcriptional regulator [Candidatus Brachybacterium merdigallinarum]|nr:MarR family transcriptional regulator [Candidatus Brachybacterium merdigallinarum]
MRDSESSARTGPVAGAQFDLDASDPSGELVDRAGLSARDIAQIDAVMRALAALRAAEKELAEASQRFMKLHETDMRALHQLIVWGNTGEIATPSLLARALGISSASTTKLLDRLEAGGHLRREPHPSDRRALALRISATTRAAAMRTIGAQQARRVNAVRRLTPSQRDVVIDFLEDMAAEIALGNEADWV